ncbi:MAG: prepilin-type N-terminal cleavage/methylation domain-containing protein [Phycisphaerales bacterium JB063]
MHSPTTRHRSAYTLIEVLITVTIMGLAAAVVVPNMLHGGTLGVQAGARMIVADTLYAQNEAMAQNEARRVLFDVPGNSYTVQHYDIDEGEWVADQNPVLGGTATTNYIIDFDTDNRFQGVEIISADFGGESWVEFDDLGNPSSGGAVRLQFGQYRYEIKIAPFSGRLTVNELNPGE